MEYKYLIGGISDVGPLKRSSPPHPKEVWTHRLRTTDVENEKLERKGPGRLAKLLLVLPPRSEEIGP